MMNIVIIWFICGSMPPFPVAQTKHQPDATRKFTGPFNKHPCLEARASEPDASPAVDPIAQCWRWE
jgi:hypothetical protein